MMKVVNRSNNFVSVGRRLMKIHYFQRYHEKENVATANTMLLLSRVYAYSPNKFFRLLKSELLDPDCILDSFEPEMTFELQAKSEASIPDAVISQNSFKIVVETKRGCFKSCLDLERSNREVTIRSKGNLGQNVSSIKFRRVNKLHLRN